MHLRDDELWPSRLLILAATLGVLHLPAAESLGDMAPCGPLTAAILDTGIDADHPEFDADQVVAWADFVNGRASPYDDNGTRHGTAVASLLAGGTLGAAPGARLVVGKILDEHGRPGSEVVIEEGLRWAIARKPDVISLSIQSRPTTGLLTLVDELIEAAHAQGILVVVAAGNGKAQLSELSEPAFSPYALVVGNADKEGKAYAHNADPEVMAWGHNVTAAARDGGTQQVTGTSFSTPRVAGWALRLLEGCRATAAAPAALEHALKAGARDNATTPYVVEGHGYLNETGLAHARRALQNAEPLEPTNSHANNASDALRRVVTAFPPLSRAAGRAVGSPVEPERPDRPPIFRVTQSDAGTIMVQKVG